MSIQLAKDEKVLKSFNYAAVGYNKKKDNYDTFKTLTVTNKRIIHEAVRETRGNELILRQEMPVADAKYIKTAMGKTATPALLVQAILFAIIAVAAVVVSFLDFAEKFSFVFWILALPFVVLAVIKLVAFFASLSSVVSFSIYTDHAVTPVMTTSVVEGDPNNADGTSGKKAKKEPELEIRVNAEVAREIADGLGAAILNAIAYKEEEETLATAEDADTAIPAFAIQEEVPEEEALEASPEEEI